MAKNKLKKRNIKIKKIYGLIIILIMANDKKVDIENNLTLIRW